MAFDHAMGCFIFEDEDSLVSSVYETMGENMAVRITFTVHMESVNFTELVGYWYSQHEHYNAADNTCTYSCDQFLQVCNKLYCIICCITIW